MPEALLTLDQIKTEHPFPWRRHQMQRPGQFTIIDASNKEVHMMTMFQLLELSTALTTESPATAPA